MSKVTHREASMSATVGAQQASAEVIVAMMPSLRYGNAPTALPVCAEEECGVGQVMGRSAGPQAVGPPAEDAQRDAEGDKRRDGHCLGQVVQREQQARSDGRGEGDPRLNEASEQCLLSEDRHGVANPKLDKGHQERGVMQAAVAGPGATVSMCQSTRLQ